MKHWWVPGLQVGYEHTFIHQMADFLSGLAAPQPSLPTFRDALATDRVIGAVLESARSCQWVAVQDRPQPEHWQPAK
jgi:myo-inositol 2-dehydrogenase/D-chiro-inositol 1-dehydrogenase